MATPSSRPLPLTYDPLVDLSTTGFYWGAPTKVINWSTSDGFAGEFFTDPESAVSDISLVFDYLSQYIDVQFNFVGYWSDPEVAYLAGSDINITFSSVGELFDNSNVQAFGLFPDASYNQFYQGAPGDIFINLDSPANSYVSYKPGTSGGFLLLHEIGHALGLKHTHDDGGTGRPTAQELGIPQFDVDWFSIMSYRDDYPFEQLFWEPTSAMALDVVGLQYLYGANNQANSGDDFYTLSITNTYFTIWDSSGWDAVSASGKSGWYIQLPESWDVNWDSADIGYAGLISEPTPKTFYWLMGDIEDALGSDGSDEIYGNSSANIILGYAGNDLIYGYGGNDYLIGDSGNDAISGGAGKDLLKGNYGADALSGGNGRDKLKGGNGNDYLEGNKGKDRLVGGKSDDSLNGGIGKDKLIGGSGDDLFIFAEGDGDDSIIDFIAGANSNDIIQLLSINGFNDFSDIQKAASQVNNNTIIDMNGDDQITLIGINPGDLHADDFLFT